MPEETQVVETNEIPIGEASMADYKKARAEGKETVPQKAAASVTVEEPPEKTIEETKTEDEKPKGKGGFQKRIDRLIKHSATLEEQLAKAMRELEARSATKPAEVKEAPKVDGEPQREDFATEVEYVRALTRWEVKQELKAEREAEEAEARKEAEKEAVSAYNRAAIEAQSRYGDWKDVMSQDTPLPSIVGDAIIHTIKNGPDVAYYLGKHPEVCQEMLDVHPLEAVAMAVKISEKLASENGKEDEEEENEEEAKALEVEQEKPPAKKFAPIKPVSGGTTKASVPLAKTDYQTYKKLRAAGRVQ